MSEVGGQRPGSGGRGSGIRCRRPEVRGQKREGFTLDGEGNVWITGFRSSVNARLALQRNEIHLHSESTPGYFAAVEPTLVKDRTVVPLYYDGYFEPGNFVVPAGRQLVYTNRHGSSGGGPCSYHPTLRLPVAKPCRTWCPGEQSPHSIN